MVDVLDVVTLDNNLTHWQLIQQLSHLLLVPDVVGVVLNKGFHFLSDNVGELLTRAVLRNILPVQTTPISLLLNRIGPLCESLVGLTWAVHTSASGASELAAFSISWCLAVVATSGQAEVALASALIVPLISLA